VIRLIVWPAVTILASWVCGFLQPQKIACWKPDSAMESWLRQAVHARQTVSQTTLGRARARQSAASLTRKIPGTIPMQILSEDQHLVQRQNCLLLQLFHVHGFASNFHRFASHFLLQFAVNTETVCCEH
jgi:hypothetical protein